MTQSVVKIKDVCDFYRGLTYSKSDEVDFSSNAVLRATNIDLITNKLNLSEIKYINDAVNIRQDKKVQVNDILICTASGSKSHLGKVAFIEEPLDMAFGGFMGVLRAKPNINPKFLFAFLKSDIFLKHVFGVSDGANINNLKFSQFENLELNLPSLLTQQKIVKKLDEIFAEIDKAAVASKANIKNAEALFQSYLTEIFERTSDGWSVSILNDLVAIKHGYAFDGKNFEQSSNLDLPIVLTPGNFTEDGKLYFSVKNTKRLIKNVQPTNEFKVGDLVVVMTDLSSQMKILGKPAIIEKNNILHNQRIGLFEFKNNKVCKKFLYFFMRTKKYVQLIKDTSTGAMVRHTAPNRILAININYPSVERQNELVSKFEALDKITSNITDYQKRKINQLNLLRKAILKKAFNGELVKD